MTPIAPDPLDYVPTSRAINPPPGDDPGTLWTQPSGVKRGLIAAAVAAAAASVICFFPLATIAIAAMAGTIWSGSRFYAWLDRDDSQPDYSDGVAGE